MAPDGLDGRRAPGSDASRRRASRGARLRHGAQGPHPARHLAGGGAVGDAGPLARRLEGLPALGEPPVALERVPPDGGGHLLAR